MLRFLIVSGIYIPLNLRPIPEVKGYSLSFYGQKSRRKRDGMSPYHSNRPSCYKYMRPALLVPHMTLVK